MPKAAPKPCTYPGCRDYAAKGGRCMDHQHKAWASNEGKSRHERGLGSKWDKLRKMILRRDGYLCKPCKHEGILTKADQVDHITPRSQGGDDNQDNLQAICDTCHKLKTQKEARNGRLNSR